jgi:hypothetical protein
MCGKETEEITKFTAQHNMSHFIEFELFLFDTVGSTYPTMYEVPFRSLYNYISFQ